MIHLIAFAVLAQPAVDAPAISSRVNAALARADKELAAMLKAAKSKSTYETTIGAYDDIQVRLDVEVDPLVFLQNVSSDAATRDAARAAEEKISNWYTDLGQREDIFLAFKKYADTNPKLDGEKLRLLQFTMRDFKRAGMALSKDKRKQLLDVQKELTKLSIQFDQNIADDDSALAATEEELAGVPPQLLSSAQRTAGLVLVPTDGPLYGAVMTYCNNEATRRKLLVLGRRRAPANVGVLEKLIKLRQQQAELLGYANTVDYETDVRMAKNAKTVEKFYDDLRPILRKKSLADLAELNEIKRAETKDPNAKMMPWDTSYYINVLNRTKYALDSRQVREYFPFNRVLDGLFQVTQSLYGLKYRDATPEAGKHLLPIWHPDAKFYEVTDTAKNQVIGYFYLDLYPRPNKYNHAACWRLRPRKVWPDGTVQLPIAALVCNFTKPTDTAPSLMPHSEVKTLFHEFGHCLHNMLTEATTGRFSGTAVSRDFVEAPSQMFENWIWDAGVLQSFARHYKTNEPIPSTMVEAMLKSRNVASGISTEAQVFLGLMDFRFHTSAKGECNTTEVNYQTYRDTMVYDVVPETYFQASFGHLTGYQAAYYSYLWSLVYAADMFEYFKANGINSPAAGKHYRDTILSRGGTMDDMAMIRNFLGREPNMKAFLKSLGLSE